MYRFNFLLLLFFACIAISCTKGGKSDDTRKPIARVHDNYLYEDQLEGLVELGSSKSDSADIIQRYVNSWIKKQLLLHEAENAADIQKEEIERKIEEYKYQLIVHEFKKRVIESSLDTVIQEDEIQSYYKDHADNFELKQSIVRAYFLQIPNEAPDIQNIKKWIRSNKTEDIEKLKSYCYLYAKRFSVNDSIWTPTRQLTQATPIDPSLVLRNNQYIEQSDSTNTYLLRVLDVKITDDISPIDYVRDQIINILINKRKVDIQKKLEDNIYESARDKKQYEIFAQDEVK